ncbi:hypothetical protein QTH91_14780 [Variovorax dokdonensis]|uniref:Pyridoxamine 5'-phosphate oxidase putative domain-containing protein n=1 Tax=Variovorax dokdonensis TaxID=344883 RepID=A0ABT7NCS5_9BURK|nr:hypothetical protein [Variovorax dokdonensis]MDM0045752.1 hypothetical protein [Variovorax dokdonensis]
MPAATALLTPELIAMIDSGVSTIVASRDAALRPSLMRAVGSSITPDGSEITVYLARSQSGQLLQDMAASGRIAVVFSSPSTHRTVQVKARSFTGRAASAEDVPTLERYLQALVVEICSIGHTAQLVRKMLAYRLEDLVAITFAPEEAFNQTPGPMAGSALPATRAGADAAGGQA